MSLLLPVHPAILTTSLPPFASHSTRVRIPHCSALFPSRLRRRLLLLQPGLSPSLALPAMFSQTPFDGSFNIPHLIPFMTLSAGFFCVRGFLGVLPPDFSDRWNHLVELSRGAESKVNTLPYHLIQAVMASEDHRFFYHFGFDPYGIGRAVVFYPNGGGGSTITQQLVKNVFLTSERKISRKFVEGILSLILERRFSKWGILYSYLSKMYWGHGKYGIEAASLFYFGKSPSMLDISESTLLAGILPGPEVLNPITNPKKGKESQARALRRMVAAGFLDLEKALEIVSQPLCLNNNHDGQEITK